MAFEEIIKVARAFENSSWALADALFKDAEGTLTGNHGMRAVAAALAEVGLDYTPAWLLNLYRAAEHFPPDRRHPGVGIRIHEAAGSPDMLDAIMKIAEMEKKPLSFHSIERIMAQIMRDERAIREQEAAAAEAEATAAEKEESKARDVVTRKKAGERKRSAKKRAQKARGAPRRRKLKPPKQEEGSFLLVRTSFNSDLGQIGKLIRRMNKTIDGALDEMTPAFCNAAIEECLSAANELRALSNLIEKNRPSGAKRGHLYALSK